MSVLYSDLINTTFPDAIDNITTMMNIQPSDANMLNLYQSAIRAGNFSAATEYLNQIADGDRKVLTATKINQIQDAILAVERFYKTNVEPYIQTKQAEWQAIINLFSYIGIFSPTTQYYKNNIVLDTSGGKSILYICTSQPPMGTPVSNATYWRQFTIQGERGESGAGSSFRFQWSPSETYNKDDIVVYSNAMWIAVTGNTNIPPSNSDPTWTLLLANYVVSFPVTTFEPTGQDVGALWFKII